MWAEIVLKEKMSMSMERGRIKLGLEEWTQARREAETEERAVGTCDG